MKKALSIMSALLLTLSCHNSGNNTGNVRGMEDIFRETLTEVLDTTSCFSKERAGALLNELADTLLNVMRHSDLHDVRSRLQAQDMAGMAIFAAAEYGLEKGLDIEECVVKFDRVMSTWRTRTREDGEDYVKEIPFNTRQDTEDEQSMVMYIIAGKDAGRQSVVLLPTEATNGIAAIFANRITDDAVFDMDGSELIHPYSCEEDDGYIVCRFDGNDFLKGLEGHDALFIVYMTDDGRTESAMVRLEELHDMIRSEHTNN